MLRSRHLASALAALTCLSGGAGAGARPIVDASAPERLAVTLYRDPEREPDEAIERDWPQGFAMVSETRKVTLPPGESTIRFTGVAEGMVAVSAIVTGLAGGTIEKNRNADLLSPAALVDGTLGNRVRITRTNPATGVEVSESAVVRTRADGGLVLETSAGFEAVRCSGLPERLSFDRVPDGLSAQPVFSIDTRDATGGTYEITLTYLSWGFDWQANYVATLSEASAGRGKVALRLMSWLTLVNDNDQSFADAELMAVAGRINVTSDFEELADPPQAAPLELTCYPLGSTTQGGPPVPELVLPSPPMPMIVADQMIVVTGTRRKEALMEAAVGMIAQEEALGDLKLYRVPERVTVAAKGMKQVAFLDKARVEGEYLYRAGCDPWDEDDGNGFPPAAILLRTVNDEKHGLGVALPMGSLALFEPSASGALMVAETSLRDYASGQDVELELGKSSTVFSQCRAAASQGPDSGKWVSKSAMFTNANAHPVKLRLMLGWASEWQFRAIRGLVLKDGQWTAEITVPAGGSREVNWQLRSVEAGRES